MARLELSSVLAASPAGEAARMAALRRLDILDTAPEQVFDDIAKLAALICGTPIALVSLMDRDRQWFKARVGVDVQQTPREISFCEHAIQTPCEVLIVPDALEDGRFKANPLVTGEPRIRFYAGAPIVTPAGDVLGSVCVIDHRPGQLRPDQTEALKVLARQTSALMEWRASTQTRQTALQEQAETSRERMLLAVATSKQSPDLQAFVGPGYVYRYVNDRYLEYWATTRERIEGRVVPDLIGPDVFESRVQGMLDRAFAGEQVDFEAVFDFPGRGPRHAEVTYLPVFDGGKVIGVVVRTHDVHELRLAQERLQQALGVLTQRNDAQQQFIYMISHDLSEPINAICNFSLELRDHHAERLDAAGQRYLRFVHEGGLRMRSLLSHLLDYVRLDGVPVASDAVNLDELLDAVLSDLATSVAKADALMHCGTLGTIRGDATLLRVLLQNLVSNALKFRSQDRAPSIRIESERSARTMTLSVSDNGIGIPLEFQEKLFGLFKQLNSRRAYEGTGLGLATCKRIVELHGGRIHVSSEVGKGSTFSAEFPLDGAARKGAPAQ